MYYDPSLSWSNHRKCMDGKQKPFIASSSRTVGSIKDQIGNHDRWTYAGKVLREDQKICQYSITEGATIFTSPALDGG